MPPSEINVLDIDDSNNNKFDANGSPRQGDSNHNKISVELLDSTQ